uniref:AlNc14C362G10998 protein n=1 Tax=Albugo laibachii Nc14 TaxID=890382 RepID=F0WXR2_9STRA|nr:AlNc14C362G10998 [Albugo laibachii Nc14]|eukprot:CCA26258.1 AlNc14C362G10998 [Albugo laibachii Nc14]
MSPTPMEQVDQDQAQEPVATHTNNDGASTASSAGEDMTRLLDIVTELKGDIGARLTRLEARRFEDDQASVVSASSSTFRAYAKTRAGLGRNMTISSLEDELIRSPV